MVTGTFPPRCIKATQCAITAFSRTGVFERRFHLVLKNNLGVQKIKFVSTTDEGFAEV